MPCAVCSSAPLSGAAPFLRACRLGWQLVFHIFGAFAKPNSGLLEWPRAKPPAGSPFQDDTVYRQLPYGLVTKNLRRLPLWLCFIASAGCWRALLRAPGVACFVSGISPPSGEGAKNLRPVLESAGPADAAGAFRILVTRPDILLFFEMHPPPAGGLARSHSLSTCRLFFRPLFRPERGIAITSEAVTSRSRPSPVMVSPHTNELRDVFRYGALSFLLKPQHCRGVQPNPSPGSKKNLYDLVVTACVPSPGNITARVAASAELRPTTKTRRMYITARVILPLCR